MIDIALRKELENTDRVSIDIDKIKIIIFPLITFNRSFRYSLSPCLTQSKSSVSHAVFICIHDIDLMQIFCPMHYFSTATIFLFELPSLYNFRLEKYCVYHPKHFNSEHFEQFLSVY